MATESSGIFGAYFKLFDTSVRMIFRPIGDTIGLILRPFALMMIKWAVPFYQRFAEEIPKITDASDRLAKGDITAIGDIRESLLKAIFGEDFGLPDKFKNEQKKSNENFFKSISDLWNSYLRGGEAFWGGVSDWLDKIFGIPKAYADTGGEIDNVNKKLKESKDIFGDITSFLSAAYEELRKRFTLDEEPRGMNLERKTAPTHKRGVLSRRIYEELVSKRGIEGANAFIKEYDFAGVQPSVVDREQVKRRGGPGSGVGTNNVYSLNVRVEGAIDNSTLDKIATKVTEKVHRDLRRTAWSK